MRDAFGGVSMIRLMLVFIFIFITFTAISLNYAKAFRVKNYIIDFVEQQDLYSLDGLINNSRRMDKLNHILDYQKYDKSYICEAMHANSSGQIARGPKEPQAFCWRGIVIEESKMVDKTVVYNVYSFADWDFTQSLKMLLSLGGKNNNGGIAGMWKIAGEARVVKRT